ncbi:MAG: hypothetical protein M1826_000785 [Phylliscum demangeonii]|nr:MAG: hypothetical protein M1826_000785 [Phylliscum demangeonii]
MSSKAKRFANASKQARPDNQSLARPIHLPADMAPSEAAAAADNPPGGKESIWMTKTKSSSSSAPTAACSWPDSVDAFDDKPIAICGQRESDSSGRLSRSDFGRPSSPDGKKTASKSPTVTDPKTRVTKADANPISQPWTHSSGLMTFDASLAAPPTGTRP